MTLRFWENTFKELSESFFLLFRCGISEPLVDGLYLPYHVLPLHLLLHLLGVGLGKLFLHQLHLVLHFFLSLSCLFQFIESLFETSSMFILSQSQSLSQLPLLLCFTSCLCFHLLFFIRVQLPLPLPFSWESYGMSFPSHLWNLNRRPKSLLKPFSYRDLLYRS